MDEKKKPGSSQGHKAWIIGGEKQTGPLVIGEAKEPDSLAFKPTESFYLHDPSGFRLSVNGLSISPNLVGLQHIDLTPKVRELEHNIALLRQKVEGQAQEL